MAGKSIQLKVWGEKGLFSRPEFSTERMSYDVLTPSAARGILESIHWKPQMAWKIDRLYVLNEIRFESIRRNEVGSIIPHSKITAAMKSGSTEHLQLYVDENRQQRAATVLRDVAYIIAAHVELTARGKADPAESVTKHVEIFRRRASKGQFFHAPCLGTREFSCDFELCDDIPPGPDQIHPSLLGSRDLGWMALDIDFSHNKTPRFFRPIMRDGVIEIPSLDSPEAHA